MIQSHGLICFFISDVHIIGLGLNYNEMDLWWVLNIRRRIKWEDPRIIKNRIYYYPVEPLDPGRQSVFSSFDVNVVALDQVLLSKDAFMPRYEAQIEVIKRNMRKRHGRTL